MHYITSQRDFAEFVARAKKSEVLAIDTEFLREKTYFAKLCLLQLATDDEQVIVDPFSVRDLSPLAELFRDEGIVKLFHAAHQDLEILYRELGCLPTPVFDTQIAAALLGNTQQMGYGAVVHAFCGVSLKKLDSFTDWSRRPLAQSQLKYAIDDVLYLPEIYRVMVARLQELNRLEWLEPEFRELVEPQRYQVDERLRYKRVKRVNQLTRRQLSAAREIAAWREIQAQNRNIPRKWIMSDEQLVEICKRESRSIDQLFMVRGVRDHVSTRDARTIVALMNSALDASPDTWPELDRPPSHKQNTSAQVNLMNAIVHVRAKENNIAVQTLASSEDLTALALGKREGLDILRGWRGRLLGNELVDLLEGRLSLSLDGSELKIERKG